MAKQHADRAQTSAAEDANLKSKINLLKREEATEAEVAAASAPKVDAVMVASAESVFINESSPLLVAASDTSGLLGSSGPSTTTLLAIGAGVLAVGGIALAASNGGGDNVVVTPPAPPAPTPPPAPLVLSAGVDTITGTAGNDTITARISEFSSLDRISGAAGTDTLVLTGTLPEDNQPQPPAVLDGAFEGTTSIERLILTGGTVAQSASATLGQFAVAAGLQEVVAGGTGGQVQVFDVRAFTAALTVTGSGNVERVIADQDTSGPLTLNLGGDPITEEGELTEVDIIQVGALEDAVAGGTQINFTSGAVGNGSDQNATLVSPNGNIVANDEGTVFVGEINNQFNVVGLDASGAVDLVNQNRGNFQYVVLGTSQDDTFTTEQFGEFEDPENIYINAGAGADTLAAFADAGERHFLVGGTGNDDLFIETFAATGTVVALAGDGNDAVEVGENDGLVNVNLGAGDDRITFTGQLQANLAVGADNDTVAGGAGRDTLAALSSQLAAIDNTAPGAVQSISGIEVLTVLDAQNVTMLVTAEVQAGIDTVSLNGTSVATSNITFDGGLASTLNLGAVATGGISVASSGAGVADQVTITNTAAAVAGVAVNAFGNQTVTATGVETLVINTTSAGTATTQVINGITVTATGTAASTVNFVGDDSVNAGAVTAQVVSAAGLTGTAGLTATTTTALAAVGTNSLTGSANRDVITLGIIDTAATAAVGSVSLGAGNDTLVIDSGTAAIGGDHLANLAAGRFTLAGGDGTADVLSMASATAATLSVANAFNANLSGFEVLSVSLDIPDTVVSETIRVDNVGVNRVISDGRKLGETLILQNLASAGTLEITGVSDGTHEVRITNSGLNTNDVLNLVLTNGGAVARDFGSVVVANTETVNISTNDIGTAANTAATQDSLVLVADRATSIVLTGNNGLALDGAFANVTTFNASGVVGNGADDTADNLGVTFISQSGVADSITGGAGNDYLAGLAGNDTITLTAGGADDVQIETSRASNGLDSIVGFTLGDSATAADTLFTNGPLVTLQDGNGAAAGVVFNATASNTVGDITLTGVNTSAIAVTNGLATLDASNVRSQITGATAQNGEILVGDGASAYILQALSTDSTTFNVYRAFDNSDTVGVVDARIELLATVSTTNAFGEVTFGNII